MKLEYATFSEAGVRPDILKQCLLKDLLAEQVAVEIKILCKKIIVTIIPVL